MTKKSTQLLRIVRPLAGEGDLPAYICRVAAGWPSPAEDYIENTLNLHNFVVKNPAATYFVWAGGDSMLDAGIHDGDLLVVDRSVEPLPGKVVIASINGELTVKYFRRKGSRTLLCPGNQGYPEFEITDNEDAAIWGVVTYVLHKP